MWRHMIRVKIGPCDGFLLDSQANSETDVDFLIDGFHMHSPGSHTTATVQVAIQYNEFESYILELSRHLPMI